MVAISHQLKGMLTHIGKAWTAVDRLMTIRKSPWWNKTRILPIWCHVSITVLHHLNFNEMLKEKARQELHKDAACCFKQILETTHCKTAIVYQLISYLTNDPSKIYWARLEKKRQTYKRCSLVDSCTWMDQCWSTSKILHSSTVWIQNNWGTGIQKNKTYQTTPSETIQWVYWVNNLYIRLRTN